MKHYFTLFLYFTMALFQRELISQHFVLMESYPHNFETTCLVKYLHKNSSGKAKAHISLMTVQKKFRQKVDGLQ